MDINEDNTKLYTINLVTQELVEVDIATQAATSFAIGNPFAAACPLANVRSWGLAIHDGLVYVGSVCSSDPAVGAAISSWDGLVFTTVHTVALNYGPRPLPHPAAPVGTNTDWRPWTSDFNDLFAGPEPYSNRTKPFPQPILSDIEFTEDSGIILGFIDRSSLQTGTSNYSPDPADNRLRNIDSMGDILRVCKVSGVYYTEGHANCPQNTNQAGDPEYFIGDFWLSVHAETNLGGLSYLQGGNFVATSGYDTVRSGSHTRSGVAFLNTTTGI